MTHASTAALAGLAACSDGPTAANDDRATALDFAELAATDPTAYGMPGVSAATWLVPAFPAELALSAEQQGRIRELSAAYDAATRADREALLAITRELIAAQQAGATRAQLRAMADRAAPIVARLSAAGRQLAAELAAVLTPAQRDWVAGQQQRLLRCAQLAAAPEYRARASQAMHAYATQTAADRAAFLDLVGRLEAARRANAPQAQLDALTAELEAVLARLAAAAETMSAAMVAAQTSEQRSLGCVQPPGVGVGR